MERFFTQASFSRLCGVSREAVRKRVNRGYLLMDPKTNRLDIDAKDPETDEQLNLIYYNEKMAEGNVSVEAKPKKAKAGKKGSKPKKKNVGPPAKKAAAAQNKVESPPAPAPPKKEKVGDSRKINADVARISAQTRKIDLEYAKELGTVIDREMVASIFGKLRSVITNNFIPMGDRLAELIAADVGITDPVIKLKIKQRVDRENQRTMEEIKRVTAEAV